MGKYIKKAKPKSELALVDSTTKITTTATTTTTTYFGVRTRAKILALQKSNTQNHDIPLSADSYLQLRSRRLKKTRIAQHSNKKKNKSQIQNPKSPNGNCGSEEKHVQQSPNIEDVSFGENVLDFEGRERNTRETTLAHLIRVLDIVRTPSSTIKRAFSTGAHRSLEQAARPVMQSTKEFDEFFAKHEAAQQKAFIEKYVFLASFS
ncbi:cyclin-dependent kinase inhibitor 4-like isoform X2 [Trifolium pratense]|uniref:cyclin-dependent kinase inhibitor 4-like isoform X2 n=1 Tax=Trifolium pratense TaxID=57577 RepID=UPI001E69114A|nr:cyclin-dependent kinase inhibitor 4-like isoform X2 [Trifolium pratense]